MSQDLPFLSSPFFPLSFLFRSVAVRILWENVQLATNENRQDVWNGRHKIVDESPCFENPVESTEREAIDRDWYRGVDLRSCPEFLMILFQPRWPVAAWSWPIFMPSASTDNCVQPSYLPRPIKVPGEWSRSISTTSRYCYASDKLIWQSRVLEFDYLY